MAPACGRASVLPGFSRNPTGDDGRGFALSSVARVSNPRKRRPARTLARESAFAKRETHAGGSSCTCRCSFSCRRPGQRCMPSYPPALKAGLRRRKAPATEVAAAKNTKPGAGRAQGSVARVSNPRKRRPATTLARESASAEKETHAGGSSCTCRCSFSCRRPGQRCRATPRLRKPGYANSSQPSSCGGLKVA